MPKFATLIDMFDTKPFEDRMSQALTHFEEELKKIRTGRAHPSMLDGVMVEAYGAKMPLNQVANVTVPEPQLLQVTPFDQANVQAVSDAIRNEQTLGFNPSDDGRIVRVPIPQLTEERRHQIVKQLGDKVEDCRISLRNIRHDGLKDAKGKKDSKELSDDDYKRAEKALDGVVADFQTKIEEITKAKEKEILTV
ncbi:ribosome recycling factor [Candidatus Saccharibacteria bacterium]|nr:ribosome recycling factor [Candidatus Saccharibacteria bacterium]